MLHLRKRCRLLPPEELKMLLSAAVMPSPGGSVGRGRRPDQPAKWGELLLELPAVVLTVKKKLLLKR